MIELIYCAPPEHAVIPSELILLTLSPRNKAGQVPLEHRVISIKFPEKLEIAAPEEHHVNRKKTNTILEVLQRSTMKETHSNPITTLSAYFSIIYPPLQSVKKRSAFSFTICVKKIKLVNPLQILPKKIRNTTKTSLLHIFFSSPISSKIFIFKPKLKRNF
jgi:hypothetical protein